MKHKKPLGPLYFFQVSLGRRTLLERRGRGAWAHHPFWCVLEPWAVDGEVRILFRALRRVTAVKCEVRGPELSSQPKARRDAKEASDARAALRKRWAAMAGKLGPGHRTKRGADRDAGSPVAIT